MPAVCDRRGMQRVGFVLRDVVRAGRRFCFFSGNAADCYADYQPFCITICATHKVPNCLANNTALCYAKSKPFI